MNVVINTGTTANINQTTNHSTPHAIRSNVMPNSPHTVIHNGVPCVAIPLTEFSNIFNDVDCINDALGDYNNLMALLAIDGSYSQEKRLNAWTVQSLHSVMHLNLDIHSDIMSNIAYKLKHYLPKDQLQAYEQAREHLHGMPNNPTA